MPNSYVQAAAEGVSKFDKAQIMRDAWQKYRDFRKFYAPWQIERGIVDASSTHRFPIA